MHLVGFTIEKYYDAWPYECQILVSLPLGYLSIFYCHVAYLVDI